MLSRARNFDANGGREGGGSGGNGKMSRAQRVRRVLRPLSCFQAGRSSGSSAASSADGIEEPSAAGHVTANGVQARRTSTKAAGGAGGQGRRDSAISMMAGLRKRFQEDPYVLDEGWSWAAPPPAQAAAGVAANNSPLLLGAAQGDVARLKACGNGSGGGEGSAVVENGGGGGGGGGRTEQRTFSLSRHGQQWSFGFTLVGSQPVRVGKVEPGSAAAAVGLLSGDIVVSVNGQTVLSCSCDTVVGDIRRSGSRLELRIQRWLVDAPANGHGGYESSGSGSGGGNAVTMLGRLALSSTVPARGPGPGGGQTYCHNRAYEAMIAEPPKTPPQKPQLQLQTPPTLPPHSRQSLANQIFNREEAFAAEMTACQQFYRRRLVGSLGPQLCSALFHRFDQLIDTTKQILRLIDPTHPADCLGRVFRSRLFQLCDDYRDFGAHLSDACPRALRGLHACPEFLAALEAAARERPDLPSLNASLIKPLRHLKTLASDFSALLAATPEADADHLFVEDVAQALEHCASLLPEPERVRLPTPPPTPPIRQVSSNHRRDHSALSLSPVQQHAVVFSGELVWRSSGSGGVDLPVRGVLLTDRLCLTSVGSPSPTSVITSTLAGEVFRLADCLEASFDSRLLIRLVFGDGGNVGCRRVVLLEAPNSQLKTLWRGFLRQRIDASMASAAAAAKREELEEIVSIDREGYADGVLIA
ncbi:hypothetical protein BOX15_Mlig017809g3 [Macrostomum lignano]|uniref:PDZ domain-containing protein n=2 Tax=Macrostomum lignano TaxID=282301 RepID=A0A267DM13_9PLAT|nr:hypothetical protein BOX15_Mlig017809g3 [Macrostomum lignano]